VEEGQRKLLLRKPFKGEDVYEWQSDEEEEKARERQQEEARAGNCQQWPRVVQVACGEQHTVAVLDNTHVVACGSGENGQLGIGNDKDANFPVRM
jgi:alpha-tubulin suppressor-like RCC1 family protein